MTIGAALCAALIAVSVIVIATTPRATWTVTDLPSAINSPLFEVRGEPGAVAIFRIDKRGRITVNEQEWNRR